MHKLARSLVQKRTRILVIMLVLAVVCGVLITQVTINGDMTKYLPQSSSMKQGVDILAEEFPAGSQLQVMFHGLSEEEKAAISADFLARDSVLSVDQRERDDAILYTLSLGVPGSSPEAKTLREGIKASTKDRGPVFGGDADGNSLLGIIPYIAGYAFLILMVILTLMCNSWVEPLLFLFTIAVAILLNMGTNIIFPYVSDITFAIAAILQLVLSMDYSIMLINRYRQEKAGGAGKEAAMEAALEHAVAAISASSITTVVGMLALVFMSFTIGQDLGFVLAKGVLISLFTIFTVLPAIILLFDKQIDATRKPALHVKMDGIGRFAHRFRYVLTGFFVLLFVGSFLLRGSVGITYTLGDFSEINRLFPPTNTLVVIFDRADDVAVAELAAQLEQDPAIDSVLSYATTLGKPMTKQELADAMGMNNMMLTAVFNLYTSLREAPPEGKLTPRELVRFLAEEASVSPNMAPFFTDDAKAQLKTQQALLETGVANFESDAHGRMILGILLPGEGDQTFAFLATLRSRLDNALTMPYYLVGGSAMALEMHASFPDEMNWITILTAVAIFLVIALAFRSVWVPLILVLIIQCAVFLTMGMATLMGTSIYYLPLLIVQCLLLGATVDYGILLTSYYREARKTEGVREALIRALNGAIHTILTSALILITVTAVLSITMRTSDPSIAEILETIARGGTTATVLVVFILPGLLAAMDRWVVGGKGR